jgi:MSHA biogenesis protein MshP
MTLPHRARRQSGFSIVSAIFLLVVLSLLGALMLTFSTVQHSTASQDIQGSRAYHAARAGIEWGLFQLLRTGTQPAPGCNPNAIGAPQFASGTGTALGGTLATFNVTVTCIADPNGPYIENGNATNIYTITATATSGASPGAEGYVERSLQVTAER